MSGVVIVGAGPAGVATAYLLARNGIEVELVERAGDFTRAFRGEGMMPAGLAVLHAMGLGEGVNALAWRPLECWEMYIDGDLVMTVPEPSRADGDLGLRVVPQPELLELIVDRARDHRGFRFRPNTTVRDLVRRDGRVCGVRAAAADGETVVEADLVIGCDGRGSVVRKRCGHELLELPQPYDVLWFKVPKPAEIGPGHPMMLCASGRHAAAAYVSWDDRLQVAAAIAKGSWREVRSGRWIEDCVGAMPDWLASHIRRHAADRDRPVPLDVVVGRCPTWHTPGALLLGDAAHPMSPIRAQGINLALRDAVVAANHLVPALRTGGAGGAVDAALAAIQAEREPEIVRCQALQQQDSRGQDLARRRPRLVSLITAIARPILKLAAATGLPQRAWLRTQRDLRYGVAEVEVRV